MPRARGRTSSCVDEDFLATILSPYKPHCRYLTEASVELPEEAAPRAERFVARCAGRLRIPESCYIDDTGHLNSVELNICYNQMLYVLMAACVDRGLAPAFEGWTLDEFRRRYLPDVLIHDLHTVFKRPIDPRDFSGELTFADVVDTRRFVYFRTSCRFWDASDGFARGDISVALMHRPGDERPGHG